MNKMAGCAICHEFGALAQQATISFNQFERETELLGQASRECVLAWATQTARGSNLGGNRVKVSGMQCMYRETRARNSKQLSVATHRSLDGHTGPSAWGVVGDNKGWWASGGREVVVVVQCQSW